MAVHQKEVIFIKLGGKCNSVDVDLMNCFWDDLFLYKNVVENCKYDYKLIKIPKNDRCPELEEGYKCIKVFLNLKV